MERGDQSIRVRVGPEPINHASLVDEVGEDSSGATVLFLGTVRDHSEGRDGVTHLDYEVYTEEVERSITRIVEDAATKWPILRAVVEHRSGRVDLGEASVAVVVASEHRSDAFDAAHHIIDELKRTAPIWKKEFWPGGEEWSRGS
jgi:molybdopterin synthase catalytic subunit